MKTTNEYNPVMDDPQCETSPGVNQQRYRLLVIVPPTPPSGEIMAVLEHMDLQHRTLRVEASILPRSFREEIACHEETWSLPEDNLGFEPKHPVEFEITVRRVDPTPGFVSHFEGTGA